MTAYEATVDDLLEAFQRACEKCATTPDWKPGDGPDWRMERAIYRNSLRAKLLAAGSANTQQEPR